jgi:hypothetical protein
MWRFIRKNTTRLARYDSIRFEMTFLPISIIYQVKHMSFCVFRWLASSSEKCEFLLTHFDVAQTVILDGFVCFFVIFNSISKVFGSFDRVHIRITSNLNRHKRYNSINIYEESADSHQIRNKKIRYWLCCVLCVCVVCVLWWGQFCIANILFNDGFITITTKIICQFWEEILNFVFIVDLFQKPLVSMSVFYWHTGIFTNGFNEQHFHIFLF